MESSNSTDRNVPHSATGYWTSSQTDSSDWRSHLFLLLNIGAPHGCVLSSLLFTVHTYNCNTRHGENSSLPTTLPSLAWNNDENSFREEINKIAEWCKENNLLLSVSKTKELIIDFWKQETKKDTSFRFLGFSITDNLSWTSHPHPGKERLRKLKKAKFLCQKHLQRNNRKHPGAPFKLAWLMNGLGQ